MEISLLYQHSQSLAQVRLAQGESVLAESGAMVGMSTNVEMQTQAGGVKAGLKRFLGGETFFRNTFTSTQGNAEVLLAPPLSGDITILEVGATQWYIQNGAYIANVPGTDVKIKTDGLKGFFGGVGFFVLETSGEGQVLIGSYGALEKIRVDGSIVIDTGHIAAWEKTLHYKVGKSASGWVSSLVSQEGLVCHFEGQGDVWMQSRNAADYGRQIGTLLRPRRS